MNRITMYNGQQKLREIKALQERLERGSAMLSEEIKAGHIPKCVDIIKHFSALSKQFSFLAEELILIEQFHYLGLRSFIKKDGKITNDEYLLNGEIELTPKTMLFLEKLKEVFGEVPHDILEIVDDEKQL